MEKKLNIKIKTDCAVTVFGKRMNVILTTRTLKIEE
jgi:hypothetical protein